jgi:hypothetical protein
MRQEAEKERQAEIDAGADPEKLDELQLPKIPYVSALYPSTKYSQANNFSHL